MILLFGCRARLALMGVLLSDMKSSNRYSAKSLSSGEVVEVEERFFELMSRASAMIWNGGNTCEVFQITYPLMEPLVVLVESLLRAIMGTVQNKVSNAPKVLARVRK